MSLRSPRLVVAEGYDRIAERYLSWGGGSDIKDAMLRELMQHIPAGGTVLDLGCGAGIPVASTLAERMSVTGVDISRRQIELARQHVPSGRFIEADMTDVAFPAASFDAVTAFFSLTHVPREQHADLLQKMADWLRPGGLLLASLGTTDTSGCVDPDWLGVPMYFSHYGAEEYRIILRALGLLPVFDQEITHHEDGHPVSFLWVILKKPALGPA